jgi:hypothetical protein
LAKNIFETGGFHMTEPIKLALIGAGSSYAPDLADILIARRRGG